MNRFTHVVLAAAGGLLASSMASAAYVDFESSTDFSNNFRSLWSNTGATTPTLTTNGAANDYVQVTGGQSWVYNAVADGAQSTFTVHPGETMTFSADVAFQTADLTKGPGSSFGVFLIDPSNEGAQTAYLALFNIDASSTNDRMRLFSGAQATGSSAGTLLPLTDVYSSSSVLALNDPLTKLTVTYSINASNQGVLTMSLGALSDSYTINAGRQTFEVGMRMSPATGSNLAFDNVSISVPEPASLGLAGLSLGALAIRRRRIA